MARARQIQDGRMDVEVVIVDERVELVALSSHVRLMVDAVKMKTGKRKAGEKKADKEGGASCRVLSLHMSRPLLLQESGFSKLLPRNVLSSS